MSDSDLEDRAAIHDLFTRYCCALDNGEIDSVVDCFTADAILKSPVIDIGGHDEIRAFATLLIQSTKLGSSIAQTLRVYASEMREKRRMRAEEKAHRLPVLLSIPLVVCMLPVMIGVLMLPAAIRVMRAVLPALAGGAGG